MPPSTETSGPLVWFEPSSTLPDTEVVVQRIRGAGVAKAVALVGFAHDSEASEASRHLPYGIAGEGVEEIVFTRAAPGPVVEFDHDAWPGEDRTFVQDDLDAAIALVRELAEEHGPDGAVLLVTGDQAFLDRVTQRLDDR